MRRTNLTRRLFRHLALLTLAVGAACGSNAGQKMGEQSGSSRTSGGEAQRGSGEAATASAASGAKPYGAMSFSEKKAHMKTVVVPTMAELFREYDAEEFGTVNCATCHGSQAMEGHFEMPNAAFPSLDPAANFASHEEHHPGSVAFMKTVVGTMAELLDEEVQSPSHPDGFSCFSCHTRR